MYLALRIQQPKQKSPGRTNISADKSSSMRWAKTQEFDSTSNPTGESTYNETQGCVSKPCHIYYPMVEMNQYISNDELRIGVEPVSHDIADSGSHQTRLDDTRNNGEEQATVISSLHIPRTVDAHQAVITRCGFKSQKVANKNQDRLLIISPFWITNHPSTPPLLVGLFDGHGVDGEVVAQFASLQLPRVLAQQLENVSLHSEQHVKQAISGTIVDIDKNTPAAASSGSTAIVILKLGFKLYIANTGDSTAFVAAYDPSSGQVDVVYETTQHKPDHPEERERIEKAGGTVTEGTGKMHSSRVIIPFGKRAIGLAMSRSIGDRGGADVGVIAEPTIDVIPLEEVSKSGSLQLFAVAATDGIFDFITPQEVADFLSRAMYTEPSTSLLIACEQLIVRASLMWKRMGQHYRDDISIAVTKL